MKDENLKILGRKLLRDTAAKTDAGKLAAQIGAMLYNGIGHRCYACKCERKEVDLERYKEQVVQLAAAQSYLERLAADEAEKLVWERS